MALARRERQNLDIWPGFVDALATLLMVIIFLLMIFVLSQVYLNEALSGRDEALQRLNSQVAELSELLTLERSANDELRTNIDELSGELRASLSERDSQESELLSLRTLRDSLTSRLADAQEQADRLQSERDLLAGERDALLQTRDSLSAQVEDAYKVIEADKETIEAQLADLARLSDDLSALEALRSELMTQLAAAQLALQEAEDKLSTEEKERLAAEQALAEKETSLEEYVALLASGRKKLDSSEADLALSKRELEANIEALTLARAETAKLNRQVAALREQLEILNATLDASEERDKEQKAQIEALGNRLNTALASKVQELARYRSDFFGKLREILGDRRDVQIVGDRFVFQSEVLFASGSDELEEAGKEQMAQIAKTLSEIARGIPADINWILRVDGHTDRVPITTERFPSNWELSTARAISVVKFLESQGIPAERLAATGFAQFQPLDDRGDEIAYRRNRRIELKLTQR